MKTHTQTWGLAEMRGASDVAEMISASFDQALQEVDPEDPGAARKIENKVRQTLGRYILYGALEDSTINLLRARIQEHINP